MASKITSAFLALPPKMASGMLQKAAEGSTVALLSGAQPMEFGETEFMDFSLGEAEFVGESANKDSAAVTKRNKRVKPYKTQITVRFPQEVQWASEASQTAVLQSVSDQMGPKLSRALDFGVFHGINPATGTRFAAMTEFLSQTTNAVSAATGTAMDHLDAAEALLLGQLPAAVPNGLAIDPSYVNKLRGRNPQTLQRIYGDFRPTLALSDVEGIRTSVNDTVGAKGINANPVTGVLGFEGDWTGIYWGVQKRVPLETILYGDPDGQGDLKRTNEIAVRAEVVYGWVIRDLKQFVKFTVA